MNSTYKVVNGRARKFQTLEAAKAFCARVFERSGVVLGIVEQPPTPRRRPVDSRDYEDCHSDADPGL